MRSAKIVTAPFRFLGKLIGIDSEDLAYASDLKDRFLASESISEQDLVLLAQERAEAIRAAFLASGQFAENRVVIAESKEVESKDGEWVTLELEGSKLLVTNSVGCYCRQPGFEYCMQLLNLEWFCQMVVHTSIQAEFAVTFHGVGG